MEEQDFTDLLRVEGVNAKGYGLIPKMVMKDTRLTIEAKAIYSYFCSYAGAGTQAFPSVSLILKDLSISEKRYYRHFALLKQFGYIKSEQIKQEGKFGRTIYTLCTHPQPSSRFDGTENSPSSRFACTQIASTQNEGTNNNSVVKVTDIKATDIKQQQAHASLPHQKSPGHSAIDSDLQNVVVVLRNEISNLLQTNIPEKELTKWVSIHGKEYIREKIQIVKGQAPTSPLRTLRAAIKDNWVLKAATEEKAAQEQNMRPAGSLQMMPAAQPGKYDRFLERYAHRDRAQVEAMARACTRLEVGIQATAAN